MIYFDNAATSRVYKEVADTMYPYYTDIYGNPSEIYDYASKSRRAMNNARKTIAQLINADPLGIYFTSGGTESDNWALIGIAESYASKGKHIITSKIEHHAILNTCKYLERKGYDITYLNVDSSGRIDIDELEKSIRSDTILISIMFANNEIGTIQDISAISNIAHKKGLIFHTDAVQAYGHVNIDVQLMGIDMLSASAHKLNGPKGIGFLYINPGIRISPYHFGGKQERLLRAGTENIPAIAGFAKAVEIASKKEDFSSLYIRNLRKHFIKRATNEIDLVRVNGSKSDILPGHVSLSFAFLDGEAIQIQLDINGICCSTGSACNAGNKQLSHVIKAINVPDNYAYGTVRFTLSDNNTLHEVDVVVDALKDIVKKLRSMSPAYNVYKNALI